MENAPNEPQSDLSAHSPNSGLKVRSRLTVIRAIKLKPRSRPGPPGRTQLIAQFPFSSGHLERVPYDGHEYEEDEDEREGRYAEERYPFSAEMPAHRPSQPFRDQVHAGHHEQGHEEGESQTENDGPGQRLPEYGIIASEVNMGIQFGEQGDEIDIKAYRQGDQGQYGGQGRQQYGDDTGLPCLDDGFPGLHSPGPQFIGEFDHEDTILHHDTCQAHDTQARHQHGHFHFGNGESQQYADHAE